MKSFIVIESRQCNFRCEYCFETHKKGKMSKGVAEQVVNVAIANGIGHISIFGGEPLLNWGVIVHMIRYAENVNANLRFSLITNGFLLDEAKLDFIKKCKIDLAISFDGIKHNTKRILKDGNQTTESVMSKIRMAIDSGCQLAICPVITADAIEGISSDYIELYELGVSRILPAIDEKSFGWTEEKFALLKQEYEIICDYCIKKFSAQTAIDFDDFRPLYEARYLKIRTVCNSCSFGQNNFVVDTNGDIYPCIQFMDSRLNVIGNIFSQLDKRTLDMQKEQFSTPLFDKCSACEYSWYCHSTCACRNYAKTKGWNIRPNCELVKMKLGMLEKYKILLEEERNDYNGT